MISQLWQWVYDLSLSEAIRNSHWAFPILECIHIYSMVSLIGLLVAFDLRMLGFAMGGKAHRRPLSELAATVLRWIWIPITINAITGGLMFMQTATTYSVNPYFQIKMSLILVGIVYHVPLLLKAAGWNASTEMHFGMKVMTVLSILLWAGVIVASRWIAYA